MTILVADDAPESRRLLELLLGRAGHRVVQAADGIAALEAILEGGLDIAFLDWMMPGLDGIEVCRRARAEEAHGLPYIVLLTGRSEPEDILRGIQAGADDYIVKPLDAGHLTLRLAVAERAVRRCRALLEGRPPLGEGRSPGAG